MTLDRHKEEDGRKKNEERYFNVVVCGCLTFCMYIKDVVRSLLPSLSDGIWLGMQCSRMQQELAMGEEITVSKIFDHKIHLRNHFKQIIK